MEKLFRAESTIGQRQQQDIAVHFSGAASDTEKTCPDIRLAGLDCNLITPVSVCISIKDEER